MTLTPMDYIRAGLAAAMADGLDVSEIWLAADTAKTPEQFDAAIQAIITAKAAMGIEGPKRVFVESEWVLE